MYQISFSLDLGQRWGTWPFVQVPSDATTWDISGLQPHSTYFVTVQAVTQAGVSEASPPTTVVTLGTGATGLDQASSDTGYQEPPGSSPGSIQSDQLLGIIVGCAIGALCVTLCTGTLLYKRRCSKPSLTPNPASRGGGGGGQCGSVGSAVCRVSPQRHRLEHGMMYEMDCMQADKHTDTNGHDCYPNGGVLLPLISNGRVPNGAPTIVRITENPQVTILHPSHYYWLPNGAPTIVRITENPQFSSSELDGERCNGEADSLLSGVEDGHHTTYTTLLETSGVASTGEGGDSGFCGGGDDRLPLSLGCGPPLHCGDQSESPNPPSPPLPPPTVPSSPSPLSLDILVDDGFHEALTSLAEPSRYCTRNRGGVVSQC
uniref:Fibronectin type-III domain-containing protein n=1 Tax=Cacopsylla melanoneura TaxID=428564 RepID=A0A8D9F127_9HEMI